MTAFSVIALMLFIAASAYAGGRLHQYHRSSLERDEAWREGYEQASGSLFSQAVRAGKRRESSTTDVIRRIRAELSDEQEAAERATVTDIADAPSAGRHSLELREAETRRLRRCEPGEQAV